MRYIALIFIGGVIFIMQGCFVLTTQTIRVKWEKTVNIEIALVNSTRYLPNTAFYPYEKPSAWVSVIEEEKLQYYYIGQSTKQASPLSIDELNKTEHLKMVQKIVRRDTGWTLNPLRYLAVPFTFAGDVVLDIVTLGYPMYYLQGYIGSKERWGTSVELVE